ncbi:Trp biosynthesis-associated membrane protein [Nocardiopsis lambiniae]|uniref:Trp biosynthesis-associated membrane protein n=1 Tax=Nocardiopsis lambiniae TaxID=3075539 RepID=A0ABU2MCR5_9ACTN|nr:Trp biosynthesis-associated membrane protein [Nocardiopsis sp. DSM 44743]MDT0330473.1 Trp biosynthesis-associated membrane protein [Nocardiopsis sp. DSM 44743]
MTSPTPRARREYGIAVVGLVVGAALLLASAGRVWATGDLTAAGPVSAAPVEVTGADLTGVPSGIGWAGLAGIAALHAARGRFRRLIGALLALGGVHSLIAIVGAVRPEALTAAVDDAASVGAARADGVPDLIVVGPAMAAAGAVLLFLVGVLALVRAPSWPGMGNRYDRDAAPRADHTSTPADLWRSLDAGDDPTLDAPGGDTAPAQPAGRAATGDGTAPAQPTARSADSKEKP